MQQLTRQLMKHKQFQTLDPKEQLAACQHTLCLLKPAFGIEVNKKIKSFQNFYEKKGTKLVIKLQKQIFSGVLDSYLVSTVHT